MTMTDAAITPKALSETELANRIKVCVAEIKKAEQNALARAIEAGTLLIQAKAKYGLHGLWGTWLNTNCELPERTAQRYMKLAEGRPKLEQIMKDKSATMADLTLVEAERLLGDDGNPKGGRDKATPSVAYDNAEKSLLKKLKALPLDDVDEHAKKTINELRDTVATMKAGAKAKAA
jgi:hypothetical protein